MMSVATKSVPKLVLLVKGRRRRKRLRLVTGTRVVSVRGEVGYYQPLPDLAANVEEAAQ